MKPFQLLGATALLTTLTALPSLAEAQTANSTSGTARQTSSSITALALPQAATGTPAGQSSASTAPPTTAGPLQNPQTDLAPADTSQRSDDQTSGTAAGTDAATPDVLVTGSRIRTPNATATIPVSSISAADLTKSARTSIGDVLNQLPQLRSTFSQSNSTRFLGTAGLNLLDLRGLGTVRTLVLVNGRRHVGSDVLNNAVSVDTNTIPTDLVEAIDIVTGGDSAVYGSDAIAGVVNFRLKNNYEGLQLRAQGGISDQHDAGSYFASLLAGKNVAEGRGNIGDLHTCVTRG